MPSDYKRVLHAQRRAGSGRRRDDRRAVASRAEWSRSAMGDVTDSSRSTRKKHPSRPVAERLHDWHEVYLPFPQACSRQAARCMDCGIPFCHTGCPLGNIIPDWNDLVYRNRWREAIDRLHATNNFPEFTGRVCPAPCEAAACSASTRIRSRSSRSKCRSPTARSTKAGSTPEPPDARTGKKVAVVGTGPAGLAAAAAAQSGRPLRHRLRAGRSPRRAADVRHSRLQAGEAVPRSPHRA